WAAGGVPVRSGLGAGEGGLALPLVRRFGSGVTAVSDAVVARWRRALGAPDPLESRLVETWVRTELLNETRPRRIEPRVRRVLRYLRREGLERNRVSLSRLAEIAQLSPSRLMHVFTQSLGIPLRPYLLWLRVQVS